MPLRNERPVYFSAKGLSDALDSTQTFRGACTSLQNLIFDPANPELLTCRPGVGNALTSFGSFTTPTGVSVFRVVGSIAYGMVSTGSPAGKDQPFAYNLATNSFITITGQISANLPTTQSTSGDWVPPTMDIIGTLLVFTHPGFAGGAQSGTCTASITGSILTVTAGGTAASNGALHIGSDIAGASVTDGTSIIGFVAGSGTEGGAGQYILNTAYMAPVVSETMTMTSKNMFGVLDLTVPAAPVWFATDTAVSGLPSVPLAVSNFNNRAYFACGNTAYFSDPLLAAQMSNAGQALTVGDTTPIKALSGLPIQTTSSGVVGALVVFKTFQIWQITGDDSITNSLAQNFISLTVGCNSPRSIAQTGFGTVFLGVDGAYILSLLGQVQPLINGQNGGMPDINQPFQNLEYPSRVSGAFTGFVYRVSVTPSIPAGSTPVDYWFDIRTKRWCGPHTFAYDCADSYANNFVLASNHAGAKLFSSSYIPSDDAVYQDNGVQISILLTPAFLPKDPNPNIKQIVESTIELTSPTTLTTFVITAYGELYQALATATISTSVLSLWGSLVQGGSGLLWGSLVQGGSGALWVSAKRVVDTYSIPWNNPLVFKKLTVTVSATPTLGLKIGTLMFKYIDTGYTNFS